MAQKAVLRLLRPIRDMPDLAISLRLDPSSDLEQVSELFDVVFGALGVDFRRFGRFKRNRNVIFG